MTDRHLFDFTLSVAMTKKEYEKFSNAQFKAEHNNEVDPGWDAGKAFVRNLHKMGLGGKLMTLSLIRNHEDLEREGVWHG